MAQVAIPKKLAFLFEPARYKVAHGGRGCLAPGSKVVMADGSLRNIEDVSVGDLLMGPDSKPRSVLKLFRGRDQMYRVKQTSAQDYVVNGAHILVLRKSESCRRDRGELLPSGNFRRPNGRYPDFPDEVEISVEDWLKKSDRWKEHFRGFRAGLIEFARKDVSIDPDKMLSQVSIEPVGEGDYFGVLLDGDHRFLLEDGTVTHNSGKSWSFAQALLILGARKKLRILCTREVQKSIKDSVHKLLSDQIKRLGLESFYQVLQTEIRGRNGTEFLFSGLSDQTADSIKSFEGVDIAWVEEAQTVTKRSWDIFRPTIRKAGSEIWVSYNPELETDATHVMFVKNKPEGAVVVEVNWHDNPYFSEELEAERQDCLKNQPKDYDNIWEGKTKPAVTGAIYYDEVTAMEKEGRIRCVPRNPTLPVHRIWDLGFNDLMAVILVQRVVSEIAIVGYVTGSRRTLADYIAEFKNDEKYARWNWGVDYLPHDGFTQRHQTGKSDADVLRGLGCKVEETPSMTVEQGIRTARTVFPRVYIDAESTKSEDEDHPGLVECLKRYRRHINKQTQTAGAPLHDQYSNGADAFRYLAINADRLPSTMESTAFFDDPRFSGRAPASRVGY